MRNAIVLVLASALACAAQDSRGVAATRPQPAEPKPNNPDVPAVIAAATQFERVVILRFKYDTVLLEGLREAVWQNGLRNGVILAGAGSVRNYHVHQVSNRTLPPRLSYVKDPAGPADILAMNGYVLDGRLHAHVTLATEEKALGGHLEPGTTVFTFAIVTIGVRPDGLEMRQFDSVNYR
jgi:predicted DNA-binding protein with PD1-like motif